MIAGQPFGVGSMHHLCGFDNGSYRRPLATGMASRASFALGSVVPGANLMAPALSGAWDCPWFLSLSLPPPDWLTEPTMNEGGQAIVGNVSHGGWGSPEKMETSS
jgi:hypothetical protein